MRMATSVRPLRGTRIGAFLSAPSWICRSSVSTALPTATTCATSVPPSPAHRTVDRIARRPPPRRQAACRRGSTDTSPQTTVSIQHRQTATCHEDGKPQGLASVRPALSPRPRSPPALCRPDRTGPIRIVAVRCAEAMIVCGYGTEPRQGDPASLAPFPRVTVAVIRRNLRRTRWRCFRRASEIERTRSPRQRCRLSIPEPAVAAAGRSAVGIPTYRNFLSA